MNHASATEMLRQLMPQSNPVKTYGDTDHTLKEMLAIYGTAHTASEEPDKHINNAYSSITGISCKTTTK